MQGIKSAKLFYCILFTCVWVQFATADDTTGLIERLRRTMAVNIDAVIQSQFRDGIVEDGFTVADPYGPQAADTVLSWQQNPGSEEGVCALRFADSDRVGYELHDFDSPAEAVASGFTVTHHGRCGSCSTLQDLAVYLETPDLTAPARHCARRFGIARKKQCFEEVMGFTAWCAESWAYNARHTKKACMGTCVSDYGFLNLLFRRYPGENVDEAGQLRPCLQCDEEESGPGFKYSAGRTRRNSGIVSAIPRQVSEIDPVDHSLYFH